MMTGESRGTNESTAPQSARRDQRGRKGSRSPSKRDQDRGEPSVVNVRSTNTYGDGPPIVVPEYPEDEENGEGYQLGELKHLEVPPSDFDELPLTPSQHVTTELCR